MSIIRVSNLNKIFNSPVPTTILSNLDLEIKQGTFNAITGKSGCGKSTLLYILSSLDTQYSGDVFIDCVHLKDKSDDFLSKFRNENIGFVFQSQFLLNELTVIRNISLPLYKKGGVSWQDADDIAFELLKKVHLENHFSKKIIELSGGQQQRVSIARALICNPKIIFADEPTGNLDSQNTKIIFELFKEITSELKKTIIVVTHDNQFASNCDNIINMRDGTIINE